MKRVSVSVKNVSVLFCLCILLLSLASCTKEKTDEDVTDKTYSFVYLFPDEIKEWETVREGAEKAVNEYMQQNPHITVDLDFIATADSATELCNNLTKATESDTCGICISMPYSLRLYAEDDDTATSKWKSDYHSLFTIASLIKEVTAKGTPVITIGNDQYLCSDDYNNSLSWGEHMDQPSRTCFVGSDNTAFGRMLGEKAVEIHDGAAKLSYFCGWHRSTEQRNRIRGLEEVIAENEEKGTERFEGCGMSIDGHPYPLDVHGVYKVEVQTVYQDDWGNKTGPREAVFEIHCSCDQELSDDIRLYGEKLNTIISLWRGGNIISDYFRDKGWNDADANKDHSLILSEDSPHVLAAVKEKFATCTLIEDRYEWGYQSAKLLLECAIEKKAPESDSVYTPVHWLDCESVWDYCDNDN